MKKDVYKRQELLLPDAACQEEVEQIVQITQLGYKTVYLSEES